MTDKKKQKPKLIVEYETDNDRKEVKAFKWYTFLNNTTMRDAVMEMIRGYNERERVIVKEDIQDRLP